MEHLGKTIILAGLVLVALGAFLAFMHKIPLLGKLPGDIYVEKKNFTLYVPLATSLLLSVIISVIVYFFGRR